jgi:hypothetical protein
MARVGHGAMQAPQPVQEGRITAMRVHGTGFI